MGGVNVPMLGGNMFQAPKTPRVPQPNAPAPAPLPAQPLQNFSGAQVGGNMWRPGVASPLTGGGAPFNRPTLPPGGGPQVGATFAPQPLQRPTPRGQVAPPLGADQRGQQGGQLPAKVSPKARPQRPMRRPPSGAVEQGSQGLVAPEAAGPQGGVIDRVRGILQNPQFGSPQPAAGGVLTNPAVVGAARGMLGRPQFASPQPFGGFRGGIFGNPYGSFGG